jgi:hypothetical protein
MSTDCELAKKSVMIAGKTFTNVISPLGFYAAGV